MTAARPSVGRRLALSAVALAVTALLLEIGLRALPARPRPQGKGYLPWCMHDPLLGWVNRPGFDGRQTMPGVFDVGIRINGLGLRGTDCGVAPSPGRPRVLVVGDSFTFGHGVETEATFAARLQARLPGVEVLNAGVVGVGHDQQWLWLRERGLRLRPDLVVWAYSSADIPRNTVYFRRLADAVTGLDYAKPRFVLRAGRPVLTHTPTPPPEAVPQAVAAHVAERERRRPAVVRFLRRARVLRLVGDGLESLAERREQMRLAPAIIRGFAATTREAGVPLLVVNLPVEKWLTSGNPVVRIKRAVADGMLGRVARGEGLDLVDLTPAFRNAQGGDVHGLFIPRDGHYSVRGHALAAEALAPAVREALRRAPAASGPDDLARPSA